MSFVGKNPKFDSTILKDNAADSVANPASGSSKIINRNGVLFTKNSSGTEVEVANLPVVLTAGVDVSGILPVTNGGTGTNTSTGGGSVVLNNSPTLLTPNLGTPSAATLTNATGLPIDAGTTGTLPVARGGSGVTTSTGSTNLVLSDSPTLVTPNLGTPSAATLTNATGLPIDGGTTGTLPLNRGGTGQTTKTAAFDALSPTTTKGDVIASDGTNNVRLGVGADGLILKADSTTATGLVWGSAAAGTGEVNYIENPDAEANTTGWSTYADAAGATPVDGTGGSPTVTWTRQSSVVLRGNQTFQLTKDAANRQGEGVSYDFSIKEQDISKKLKIQFDFKTNEDAAYASGDLTVYIYDVTNSTLITPVDTSIIRGQNIYQTSFNSTTSTSYRLIFHIATTNASAWDAYIDNVIVGPGMTSQGAAIGGWEDAGNITNYTVGNGTQTSQYRRVGSDMEIQYTLLFGSTTVGATTSITIPNGLTIDTSVTGTSANPIFGYGTVGDATSPFNKYDFQVLYNNSTTAVTRLSDGSNNQVTATSPITFTTNDYISFTMKVPIAEWAGKGIVPMLAEDNLSEWQSYTPASYNGIGTPTNVNLEYARVGDSVYVRGFLTTGTVSASEIRIALPQNLTIGGVSGGTVTAGKVLKDATDSASYYLLTTAGDTFLNVGAKTTAGSLNATTPGNGSSFFSSSQRITLRSGPIPIAEWAGSQNSLVGYSLASSSNAGLLKSYDEGTWTPTSGTHSNLTGTAVYTDNRYTKIGNKVFVTIGAISGLTVTTTGIRTFIRIDCSDLPGVTNSTEFFGTGRVASSGSAEVTASCFQASASDQQLVFAWKSDGAASLAASAFQFHYYID